MADLVGALMISLGLDSANFRKGMSQAERQFVASTKKFQALGASLQDVGARMTMGLTAPLIAAAAASVKGANDQAQAMAQVEASLASMGNASGKTADELLKMSDAMEMKSLFDGDVILKDLTANLLTFGNIAGEEFDRAQQAALDFATKMDKDLGSSAIMVGKALNDPVKGMSALGKAGIQFTDSQKAMVEAMVETGDVAGAQNIILQELEKQYGGSAAAAANTSPWRQLQVAIGQVGDVIGEILLPFVRTASEKLAGFAAWFRDLSPGVQSAAVAFGALVAAAGPLTFAIGGAMSVMAPFLAAVTSIGASGGIMAAASAGMAGLTAAISPMLGPLAAVAAAGYLIYQNWNSIGPAFQGFAAGLGIVEARAVSASKAMQTTFSELQTQIAATGVATAADLARLDELMKKVQNGAQLNDMEMMFVDVMAQRVAGAANITDEESKRIIKSLDEVRSANKPSEEEVYWDQIGKDLVSLSKQLDGWAKSYDTWVENNKKASRAFWSGLWADIDNWWKGMTNWAGQIKTQMAQIGKDIIAGLVRGIKAAPQAVYNALKDVVFSGVRGIKNFLGIKSPSRLFMEMGGFVVEGFAIGIEQGEGRVVASIRGMGKVASDEMKTAFKGMWNDSQAIIDRLFPADARRRQFREDSRAIANNPFLGDARKAELQRLLREEALTDLAGGAFQNWQQGLVKRREEMSREFAAFAKAAEKKMQEPFERVVESMANAMANAAQNIGNALRGIGEAFKNGGFWDKLGAIADLVSAGANAYAGIKNAFATSGSSSGGSNASASQSRMNAAIARANANYGGARADGGPVDFGKSYLVGERGPEIFTPRSSGTIIPNGGLTQTVKVLVEANDYFDAKVVQTSSQVTGAGINALESRRNFSSRRAI